jgi:prepilin-type N-terminal cleavage/methylation domain-containing protein
LTEHGHQADAGFSLVEILVVLSVIGLMSGLMLTMVGQFRHYASAERRLNDQMALQKTTDHIAGLLERSMRLPLEFRPDAETGYLKASDGSLRFLGNARTGSSSFSLSNIEVELDRSNATKRLVQKLFPRRLESDRKDEIQIELLSGVDSLSFSFLAEGVSPAGVVSWQKDWLQKNELPKAIRVELSALGESGSVNRASSIALISH